MTPRETNELERRIEAILAEHGMSFGGAEAMIQGVIRKTARSMPNDDVHDCTQEVWLALCRFDRAGGVLETASGWLAMVARRQGYQWMARHRRWVMIDPADPDTVSDPMDRLPAEDPRPEPEGLLLVVREMFHSGSPGCLQVFDRVSAGLSLQEVAEALGRPYTAVRQQWSRCMKFIRKVAEADGGELAGWFRSMM